MEKQQPHLHSSPKAISPKLKWYEHANIVSMIAFYLDPKSIFSSMEVCRNLHKHLNTNKIWWLLYNKAFTTIRTLDQPSWIEASETSCPAKEAFISTRKAAGEGFKVEPSNIYRACLNGRIGSLPKSETLTRQFGDKYDLLASFSNKFIIGGKICQVRNIFYPTLDKISTDTAIMIMVNPADKELVAITIKNALLYIQMKDVRNLMLLVNVSKDEHKRYDICPDLENLEALIGTARTYLIKEFSEETLAKVAYMIIELASDIKSH